MNRFLFVANLLQVAWFAIHERARRSGRDADAVLAAFDWGVMVREVLLTKIERPQSIWEARILNLVHEAELKVPAPTTVTPAIPPWQAPGAINGN